MSDIYRQSDEAETDSTSKSYLNRRQCLVLGGATAAGLAGCVGSDDDDTEEQSTDEEMSDTDGGEDEGGGEDDEGEDETEDRDVDDLKRLVEIFDDQPMNDAQHVVEGEHRKYTPRHVWKFVTEDTFIGLHFDDRNPEAADSLHYILVGQKGLMTEESQPGPEFSHFHQHTAESWEAGHGGEVGEEGYWLTHIAVDEIEYPFHEEPISPSVDYGFFPTPPEPGTTGHRTNFDSPGGDEGQLSVPDRDALLGVFDHQPMNEKQRDIEGDKRSYTPQHVWFEVNDDVILFLHFNEFNPETGVQLDWFGMGVSGQFTVEDIPAGQTKEFTHFHDPNSEGWLGGHGGDDTETEGYWLVHHSVRPLNYPFHQKPIDVGVDRQFLPTPAPDQ